MERPFLKVIFTLFSGAMLLHVCAGDCLGQLDTSQWPAGVAPRPELSQSRSRDLEFAGISTPTLQRWLRLVNIDLPVSLDGDLSGWIWLQRSSESWFDLSGYRLEGAIRSSELTIDNWVIRSAVIRFGFVNGDWYFGRIAGSLASTQNGSPIGDINAQARITAANEPELQIAAEISGVRLQPLFQAFAIDLEIDNVAGSLRAQGVTPVFDALDLACWDAKADVDVEDVELPWIRSTGNLQVSVGLAEGIWSVTQSRLEVARQIFDLSGTGRLNEQFPFEWTITGRDIDFESLVLGWRSPALCSKASGLINLDANLIGDLVVGVDQAAISMNSEWLLVDELPVRGVRLQGDYSPAGIQVEMEAAEFAGGSLAGSSKWRSLDELGRIVPSQAHLKVDQLDLRQLTKLAAMADIGIGGLATGSLTVGTKPVPPLDQWETSGSLTIADLELSGVQLGSTALRWNKELASRQMLSTISVEQDGGRLESDLVVRLQDREDGSLGANQFLDYTATGQLTDYRITAQLGGTRSRQLSGRIAGSFEIGGRPENWMRRGQAELSRSEVAVESLQFTLESAELDFDEEEIRLTRLKVDGSAGRLDGDATWKRKRVGQHRLRLRLDAAQLHPLIEAVPGDLLAIRSLKPLSGIANLDVQLAKDASTDELVEQWQGNWQGSLSDVAYRRQPLGQLDFRGQVVDQIVSASVNGQLLGGETEGSLTWPLSFADGQETADGQPLEMQIQLTKAQAPAVARLLLNPGIARQLQGSLSIELSSAGKSLVDLVTEAQIELHRIRLKRQLLTRDLVLQTRFNQNRMQIVRLSGGLAEGRIEAQGFVGFRAGSFGELSQSEVNFVAQRLNANQLVSAVDLQLGPFIAGDLNCRGTLFYQRGIHVKGTATVQDATVVGIPIERVSGAVRAWIDSGGQFRRLTANDLHGSSMGGTLAGEVTITAENRVAMLANGRLQAGRLEQLSTALGFPRITGSGRFDSSFNFQSANLASLQSLTGNLQMEFRNGDAGSVPILSGLGQFVPLFQFASTDFQNGRMRAWIGQGQFRIRDLVLNGDAFSLLAYGTAALDGSNLNIDAILQTGGGVQQRLVQSAVEKLLVGVAPPISAIQQLNEIVRNRSLFLHVAGRPSRPVIQTRTGPTVVTIFLQNFARGITGIPGLND